LPNQRHGYLLQPTIHDAIDVFDLITLLELRRAARLCQVLRPASRDVIRYRAVRQRQSSRPSDVIPRGDKQQRPRATSFLPTSSPSTISGRLGHLWFHKNWARTSDKSNTWKPPDQSSLHDICRTGTDADCVVQTWFFFRRHHRRQSRHQSIWWS